MRPLSYRETDRRLRAAGFELRSQKGSHVKYVRETAEGRRTAIVPAHKEIAAGTLRSILRQAGLSEAEFENL